MNADGILELDLHGSNGMNSFKTPDVYSRDKLQENILIYPTGKVKALVLANPFYHTVLIIKKKLIERSKTAFLLIMRTSCMVGNRMLWTHSQNSSPHSG